jgi:talin
LFQQSDELEQLAEKELMAAASTIEEAARTLLEAKKRQLAARKNQDSPLPEEEITEAILDAARAITTATGTLVASATAAQKELVEKGRVSRQQSVYRRDPAWAKGLISAAQSVAGTVKDLVAAANSAAQGKAEEEVLVASAKGVAASTARLVYASRTKADPFSPAQKNLSSAAKSVAAATQSLVQAAKSATQLQEDEEAKPDWSNQTQQRKAEMEAQMKILKLQKELDKERFRLGEIRKNEYKDANVNVAGEQASSVLSSQAPRTTPVRALPKSPSSGQSPSNASLAPTKKSSRPLKPFYTLEELQAKPPELDQESLEQYLSDDDFQKLFGIDKKTFLKFPAWKRTSEKKRYGLY